MSPKTFSTHPWYDRKRDGSLEEYFETHDGHSCFPLFKGHAHYKLLWNKGYLQPEMSIIRLMWNIGREDEHFLVKSKDILQGIEAPAPGCRPR
jgi:hypothetical protein